MRKIPKYTIKRELGNSNIATVYLAKYLKTDNLVALKVIKGSGVEKNTFHHDFLTIAQCIAKLEHPYIVNILDIGVTDDNTHYLAMEYLDKGNLSTKIQQEKLPIACILKIMQNVGSALNYLHHQGLVHCNVKPDNILFDSNENAKLADSGIAQMQDALGDLGLQGTLHYMSPEQSTMIKPDKRSDIYSLGLVLYEMLTTKKAFTIHTTAQAIYQHTMVAPPNLPFEYHYLQPVLDKAVAKSPRDRYTTMEEMLHALKKAINTNNRVEIKIENVKSISADYAEQQRPTNTWSSKGIIGLTLIIFILIVPKLTNMIDSDTPIKSIDMRNFYFQVNEFNQEKIKNNMENNPSIPYATPTSKISINVFSAKNKKPLVTRMVIFSKEDNEIIVDGKNLEKSEFELEVGEYVIRIEKKGYISQSKLFTITDSPKNNLTFHLKPIVLMGELKIETMSQKENKSLPATYEIHGINNDYYKKQKTARFKLPFGRYILTVKYKDKIIKKNILIKSKKILRKKIVFSLSQPKKSNRNTERLALSRIYIVAKLGNSQGRNLPADFFLYQNKRIIKKVLRKNSIQFQVPPGEYIIKVVYKGVSSQANAILGKKEVIEQVFVYEDIPSFDEEQQ